MSDPSTWRTWAEIQRDDLVFCGDNPMSYEGVVTPLWPVVRDLLFVAACVFGLYLYRRAKDRAD